MRSQLGLFEQQVRVKWPLNFLGIIGLPHFHPIVSLKMLLPKYRCAGKGVVCTQFSLLLVNQRDGKCLWYETSLIHEKIKVMTR